MTALVDTRHLRSLRRVAGRKRRLRAELGKLDDMGLLTRLSKDTGHTVSELRRSHRNIYASSVKAIHRDHVIDRIVMLEIPE